MGKSLINVSIVTYKTKVNDLLKIIASLTNNYINTIYIIDNSPTDELKVNLPVDNRLKYVYGHGNIGYGAGHNISIKLSIKEDIRYHIVVNPDVYFAQGSIESLVEFMETNVDVGQVMPKVYYPDGELQFLCKKIPTPLDLIFKRFIPSFLLKNRMNKFQLKFTGYNKIMNIPYLSGCFMLFRVSALKEVGLFDERFFMYPEDIDITRRMHEKYKTIFYPEVSIIHAHAAESKISYRMLWVHIWNMIKYFNKWGWFFDKKRSFYNKRLMKDLM